jgi:hypothetical protein
MGGFVPGSESTTYVCNGTGNVVACDIDLTLFASGAPNPANACQVCQPALSTTSWSSVNDGTVCGTSDVCVGGACTAGCFIAGSFYATGATNPSNDCQSCQPAAPTTWSDCSGGTTCCSDACVNEQTDSNNCGGCAIVCPAGNVCFAGGCLDPSTTPLWSPVGPQTNVPAAQLFGWTPCYQDQYGGFGPSIASIQAQCSGNKIMLACRQVGAATYDLLAWAPRADVFFDTPAMCGTRTAHNANGSEWYFNTSWSWGFANQGDTVSLCSCDTDTSDGQDRLCWHTGGGTINGGYRCGNNVGLNGSTAWERVVLQAN